MLLKGGNNIIINAKYWRKQKHVPENLYACRIKVEAREIVKAMKQLKKGKWAGMDGLNSEHYKYVRLALSFFSLVDTVCIVHYQRH